MSQPFIGEIRVFSFNFAPVGWALCDGAVLSVSENRALFGLIGNKYGGDGVNTFALPDFQGRTPICFGAGYALGHSGGEETHALLPGEMPEHTHTLQGTNDTATTDAASGLVYATAGGDVYGAIQGLVQMNSQAVSTVGNGQSHENMQPYLTLNFCIATQGATPPGAPPAPPGPPGPPPLSPEDIKRLQQMLHDLANQINNIGF